MPAPLTEIEKIERELELLETKLQVLMSEDEYDEAERSLYAYFMMAWPLFDSAPLKTNWHIGAIAEHLQACYEGQIKKVVFNVPPGSSKSSLISVAGPTWLWGPANAPHTKFMTASYGTAKGLDPATRDNVRSRRLIQTDWYQERWKDRFRLSGDMNLKTVYENNKNGSRLATSIGGGGTGLHYDVLQVDDPSKASDENSENALEAVIEWWTGTMPSRMRDPETARKVLIMQRIAQKDLAGHIREVESGWTLINIPMEYEPTTYVSPLGWKDPRKVEGELMNPDRFSRDTVENLKRELGPYKYAAQYQQRPTPKGGGKIKADWFRYYYNPPGGFEVVIQAWDLIQDDTQGADYAVGTVWGKRAGDRYLLDMKREKMDIVATCNAIAAMYKKWPMSRAVLIENKANGPAVNKLLKNSEWIRILGVQVTGIILVDPKEYGGSKEARLAKCVPELSSGNVLFPHTTVAPWIKIVEQELTMFPKAAHDDTVDSLTYALNYLAEKFGMRTGLATPRQGDESTAIAMYSGQQQEKVRDIFTATSRQVSVRPSGREIRGYF